MKIFDSSIAVFTNSNWFALWVFLFVYSIAMTTYCFISSVLFSQSNTAAAVSGLMWFISYMPYMFLTLGPVKMSLIVKLIACMSPNVAMAFGCLTIVELERNLKGLQWSNFWGYPMADSNLSVGLTVCFMLISSILFLLITLYIEKVLPGEYGVPEEWDFPFKKEFWFGAEKDADENQSEYSGAVYTPNDEFEPEPTNCLVGIQVKDLRKTYDNGKIACKGITFNMYYDQTTVLLGHNGAGKSTAIKMLTGMIPPTSGTAIINGYDIQKELEKARESIGICPQHDILFDELTVGEHIAFYSRLKGLKQTAVQKEVNKYVHLLNLESKIDAPSKSLSGGMKRKLSFGIALCGNSKVVLCDEPTSGMDPAARRELWDLVQSEKIGRTIILTTHFMDEADVLGDRIAIMADGQLKCCGTPFFLKKRYGSGYHLIFDKKDGCDSSDVTNVLRDYIANVEVLDENAGVVSYALPYDQVDKFGKMFERLENELEILNLHNFGVSPTELEEVFLKVGSDNKRASVLTTTSQVNRDIGPSDGELVDGYKLHVNQWHAMFKKRYYSWFNSWHLFLIQNLILILFIVISVIFAKISKEFNELPTLELSLNSYGENVVMLETPRTNCAQIER